MFAPRPLTRLSRRSPVTNTFSLFFDDACIAMYSPDIDPPAFLLVIEILPLRGEAYLASSSVASSFLICSP